jgi:hypothetical protein
MAESITLDELIAACQDAGMSVGEGDAGFTRVELMSAWKCSDKVAARNLKLAQGAGILKVGRKLTTNLAGVPCSVPVYSFVLPKKAKR